MGRRDPLEVLSNARHQVEFRPFLESPLPYVMRTMAHQLLVTLDTHAPHISSWGEGHYRTP